MYIYIYIYLPPVVSGNSRYIKGTPDHFVYRLEYPGSQGYWSEEGAIERTKVRLDPLEPLV